MPRQSPRASQQPPGAIFAEKVEPSRNTIIRVRIAHGPASWAPFFAACNPKVKQKCLQRVLPEREPKNVTKKYKNWAKMEPKMDPKIDQNPSLSPPGAQDEPKVPPRPLPDLQNEVPGLKKWALPGLKNEPPGPKKITKIRGSDALTEDIFSGLLEGDLSGAGSRGVRLWAHTYTCKRTSSRRFTSRFWRIYI